MTTQRHLPKGVAESWQAWQEEQNSLCHEVFMNTVAGARLLKMWEEKFFYAPVADPAYSHVQCAFNEGNNNFIRRIRVSMYTAMQPKESTQLNKDIDYERQDES